MVDTPPFLRDFGDCTLEPSPLVTMGETVITKFVSGHPRNNPMMEGTFFVVEILNEDTSEWELVTTDGDWNTK